MIFQINDSPNNSERKDAQKALELTQRLFSQKEACQISLMVDDAVERRVGIVAKQEKELNDLETSENPIIENAGLLDDKSESKKDKDVSEILHEKKEPEKQEATKRSYT